MMVHAKYKGLCDVVFFWESHERDISDAKAITALRWIEFFSDFVELHVSNMLSFIQFGQVGKKKMFKQMFDARLTLSVTIAHVDSLGQVN